MGRLLLALSMLLVVLSADGAAARPGELSLSSWQTSLAGAYEHYRSVDAEVRPRARCPRARGLVTGKALHVELRPARERAFSRLWVRVSRLAQDADPYRVLAGGDAPDPCVSKRSHLLLAWSDWLVELELPCRAGQLAHYDIGDFLAVLGAILGDEGRPEHALLSRCGAMTMRRVPLDALETLAAKPRRLWGKRYPQHRARARQER